MRNKVWVISLIYNDADVIEQSITQAHETKSQEVDWVHVLVDAHWPINHDKVKEALARLTEKYGCIVIDPGHNLGLHGNFNHALASQAIPDNAMVIGLDPDCWPVTPNWDKAMCDVFNADEKIVWLSLWHAEATRELLHERKSKPETTIVGHRVVEVASPVINSVCGFRMGWLNKVNGITEPSRWYGGLECAMWQSVLNHGRWVFLPDYREEPHFKINPDYTTWKWKHAHQGYPHDFSHYLKEIGHIAN